MTKKEMFRKIAEVCADNEEIVEFCNKEIERLNVSRSSSKPTKNQIENIEYKGVIIDALAKNPRMTISDLMRADARLSALSNQRVNAIVIQLKQEGKVERTTDKRTAYFSLAKVEQ